MKRIWRNRRVLRGFTFMELLVMSNELNTPKILICPQERDPKRMAATTFDSARSAGGAGQIAFTNNNNVSYFVGADALEAAPQMVLSGDDNLAFGRRKLPSGLVELWTNSPIGWTSKRHANNGNILLLDGSVQGLNTARLRAAFGSTGVATNRLLMP